MKYILIIALVNSISMQEFDDKQACNHALKAVSPVYLFTRSVLGCYPKGTPNE